MAIAFKDAAHKVEVTISLSPALAGPLWLVTQIDVNRLVKGIGGIGNIPHGKDHV